jgi:hypothetical protein
MVGEIQFESLIIYIMISSYLCEIGDVRHTDDTTGISVGTVAAKFVVLFLQIMVIIAP